MPLTMAARARNTSRTSGEAMRSTYLWRYRVSTSCKPLCLSGSGRSDFVSISTSSTAIESSSFSVRFTAPFAPTMSPTSTKSTIRLNAPAFSPPLSRRFLSQYSWIDPESSSSDKNASLPNTRRALTRPHTASGAASESSTPASSPVRLMERRRGRGSVEAVRERVRTRRPKRVALLRAKRFTSARARSSRAKRRRRRARRARRPRALLRRLLLLLGRLLRATAARARACRRRQRRRAAFSRDSSSALRCFRTATPRLNGVVARWWRPQPSTRGSSRPPPRRRSSPPHELVRGRRGRVGGAAGWDGGDAGMRVRGRGRVTGWRAPRETTTTTTRGRSARMGVEAHGRGGRRARGRRGGASGADRARLDAAREGVVARRTRRERSRSRARGPRARRARTRPARAPRPTTSADSGRRRGGRATTDAGRARRRRARRARAGRRRGPSGAAPRATRVTCRASDERVRATSRMRRGRRRRRR